MDAILAQAFYAMIGGNGQHDPIPYDIAEGWLNEIKRVWIEHPARHPYIKAIQLMREVNLTEPDVQDRDSKVYFMGVLDGIAALDDVLSHGEAVEGMFGRHVPQGETRDG